ncbi:hypothetical protein DV736_g5367, partial [Chaetothyriales sp. CBS 134916]
MRFSILLSALAASALATPAVNYARPVEVKRGFNLGGITSPDVAQVTGVLANAFGSLTGINGAVGSLNSLGSIGNVPGDLLADTTLLLQNSQLEILSIADSLNNAVNGLNLNSQLGVVSSSAQIVTAQVQQLLNDLTGIGNFYPDTAAVTNLQDAAGSLLGSLNHLQASI